MLWQKLISMLIYVKKPNQDSEKVGVLYKDCGGDILQRQDSWTKIQSGDVTGWVSDDYLYFGEEAQKEAKKSVF